MDFSNESGGIPNTSKEIYTPAFQNCELFFELFKRFKTAIQSTYTVTNKINSNTNSNDKFDDGCNYDMKIERFLNHIFRSDRSDNQTHSHQTHINSFVPDVLPKSDFLQVLRLSSLPEYSDVDEVSITALLMALDPTAAHTESIRLSIIRRQAAFDSFASDCRECLRRHPLVDQSLLLMLRSCDLIGSGVITMDQLIGVWSCCEHLSSVSISIDVQHELLLMSRYHCRCRGCGSDCSDSISGIGIDRSAAVKRGVNLGRNSSGYDGDDVYCYNSVHHNEQGVCGCGEISLYMLLQELGLEYSTDIVQRLTGVCAVAVQQERELVSGEAVAGVGGVLLEIYRELCASDKDDGEDDEDSSGEVGVGDGGEGVSVDDNGGDKCVGSGRAMSAEHLLLSLRSLSTFAGVDVQDVREMIRRCNGHDRISSCTCTSNGIGAGGAIGGSRGKASGNSALSGGNSALSGGNSSHSQLNGNDRNGGDDGKGKDQCNGNCNGQYNGEDDDVLSEVTFLAFFGGRITALQEQVDRRKRLSSFRHWLRSALKTQPLDDLFAPARRNAEPKSIDIARIATDPKTQDNDSVMPVSLFRTRVCELPQFRTLHDGPLDALAWHVADMDSGLVSCRRLRHLLYETSDPLNATTTNSTASCLGSTSESGSACVSMRVDVCVGTDEFGVWDLESMTRLQQQVQMEQEQCRLLLSTNNVLSEQVTSLEGLLTNLRRDVRALETQNAKLRAEVLDMTQKCTEDLRVNGTQQRVPSSTAMRNVVAHSVACATCGRGGGGVSAEMVVLNEDLVFVPSMNLQGAGMHEKRGSSGVLERERESVRERERRRGREWERVPRSGLEQDSFACSSITIDFKDASAGVYKDAATGVGHSNGLGLGHSSGKEHSNRHGNAGGSGRGRDARGEGRGLGGWVGEGVGRGSRVLRTGSGSGCKTRGRVIEGGGHGRSLMEGEGEGVQVFGGGERGIARLARPRSGIGPKDRIRIPDMWTPEKGSENRVHNSTHKSMFRTVSTVSANPESEADPRLASTGGVRGGGGVMRGVGVGSRLSSFKRRILLISSISSSHR